MEHKELQIPSSGVIVDYHTRCKNNVGKRSDHMVLGTQVFIRANIQIPQVTIYPEYCRKIMMTMKNRPMAKQSRR